MPEQISFDFKDYHLELSTIKSYLTKCSVYEQAKQANTPIELMPLPQCLMQILC